MKCVFIVAVVFLGAFVALNMADEEVDREELMKECAKETDMTEEGMDALTKKFKEADGGFDDVVRGMSKVECEYSLCMGKGMGVDTDMMQAECGKDADV